VGKLIHPRQRACFRSPQKGRFGIADFAVGSCGAKATVAIIERLHADRVIGSYAIGDAVGATFYLEPMATLDVDVFVLFEPTPRILTLTPIYEACAKLGYQAGGDALRIEGWPVQFFAASDPRICRPNHASNDG
jgi:hypothetical protein